LITQFGLSTGHIEEDGKTHVKVWNFYVFPRPYGNFDVRFLCQASSLQFLSEHGFDFNKFIADGVPYITLSKTKEMKEQLEKKIDRLDNFTRQLYLTKDPEIVCTLRGCSIVIISSILFYLYSILFYLLGL
jgi:hypothetical protein